MAGTPGPGPASSLRGLIGHRPRRKNSRQSNSKLAAEAGKFNRERWLILVGAVGGVAALLAALVTMAKTSGRSARSPAKSRATGAIPVCGMSLRARTLVAGIARRMREPGDQRRQPDPLAIRPS